MTHAKEEIKIFVYFTDAVMLKSKFQLDCQTPLLGSAKINNMLTRLLKEMLRFVIIFNPTQKPLDFILLILVSAEQIPLRKW